MTFAKRMGPPKQLKTLLHLADAAAVSYTYDIAVVVVVVGVVVVAVAVVAVVVVVVVDVRSPIRYMVIINSFFVMTSCYKLTLKRQ